MFNLFNIFKTTTVPTFSVQEVNGRFAIMDSDGVELKSYSRRSDAVRGANRLGLNIA